MDYHVATLEGVTSGESGHKERAYCIRKINNSATIKRAYL